VLFCFDLPYFAGIDLRKAPYRDRRRYLAQCLLPTPLVQLVHAQEDGVALAPAALASGFEGVIGKRKDSRYEAGKRSGRGSRSSRRAARNSSSAATRKARLARTLGAMLWATGKAASCASPPTSARDSTTSRREAEIAALTIAQENCPFDESRSSTRRRPGSSRSWCEE
jgi:bifunctional non-homologous end joining protein LigD